MPSKGPEVKARAIELFLHSQADLDIACSAISDITEELNFSREIRRIYAD